MVLTGRDEDLDRAQRLILNDDRRVITVTGRPGIGKSWMLGALSAALEAHGIEVWRADLSTAAPGSPLLEALIPELGIVSAGTREESASDLMVALIAHRRVVIAVDHADAGLDSGGIVEVVARCPRLTLVIASHLPLGLDAENIHLESLDVPPPAATADQIRASASVRLFIDVAEQVNAHITFDDATASTVAEVCRLLSGLPLAIVLAAARMRLVSPAQLLHRLNGEGSTPFDLGLLANRSHSGGSIREAIEATVSTLPAAEQGLLRTLALFDGPFPLGAAIALTEQPLSDMLDALEGLVEVRLIEPVDGPLSEPTFVVTPIARAFAREHGPSPELHARYLPFLRSLTRTAAEAVASAEMTDELAQARALRRDIVRHLHQAAACDIADAAPFAVDAMAVLAGYTETAAIGEILDTIIDTGTISRLDPWVQASVWLWASRRLALSPDGLQHAALVRARWDRGMAIVDEHHWPQLALQGRLIAILNGPTTGDASLAARSAAEGGRLAAAAAWPGWAALFDALAAAVAFDTGDLARAASLSRSALERGQRVNAPAAIVVATLVLRALPDHALPDDAAVPSLEEAVALASSTNNPMAESALLAALTRRELLARHPYSAAHWCAQRLQSARRRGWSDLMLISLVHATIIGDLLGDLDFAVRMAGVVHTDQARVLRSMTPEVRPVYTRAVTRVRARLGSQEFARRSAVASMMSRADAADEAIEWLRARADIGGRSDATAHPLTAREHDVLGLLARGLSNKEIAEALHLSAKTVMHHSVAIYRKLGVRGRAEATSHAYRNRLLATIE